MNSRRRCAGNASAILSTKQGRLSGMRSRGNIPRPQPTRMPKILEASTKDSTEASCCCLRVRRGCGRPSLSAKRSMRPCSVMPEASDTICPMPAAANVDMPSAMPMVDSMAPPTVNMIMLSKKPNPTKGTAVRTWRYQSCHTSGLAVSLSATAESRASARAFKSQRAEAQCSAAWPSTEAATRLQKSGSDCSLAMTALSKASISSLSAQALPCRTGWPL
mmetsp:Transcript_56402/g.167875  ORF Transcript_56402/g.167875 Transcript_56402/m.167875 type:complete len:219 (-) Transcript_56402:333-989(-)